MRVCVCVCRVFWQNDSSGINQRGDDFWNVVARNVQVYRRKIAFAEKNSVILEPKSGSKGKCVSIPADVLIYCTGWSVISPLMDDVTAAQLGLPASRDHEDPKQNHLECHADAEVLSRFPDLALAPPYRKIDQSHSPFRLYKTMAPISDMRDRSILFLGRLIVGNNFLIAEVQALWAVAYLDGHIKCSPDEMRWDVAKTVAWNRRRYLNKGQIGVWLYFDVVKYADMLLAQLGLTHHNENWWGRKMFAPFRAKDVNSLLDRYKALYLL